VSLDRASIWRDEFAPHTKPVALTSSNDSPGYKKEVDREESGRDRSTMSPEFKKLLVENLRDSESIILISAGEGKANAGHVLLEFLKEKESKIASSVLEVLHADVNKLTENELLALGRGKFE
jgi:hypothetical protein